MPQGGPQPSRPSTAADYHQTRAAVHSMFVKNVAELDRIRCVSPGLLHDKLGVIIENLSALGAAIDGCFADLEATAPRTP